jgi:N-acetylmuramoyl-L-alanine amidase
LLKRLLRFVNVFKTGRTKNLPILVVVVLILGMCYKGLIIRSIPVLRHFIQVKTVAIDPGHGTVDPGVVHKGSGIEESKINLDVAQKLKRLLSNKSYNVVLTRERETRKKIPIRQDLKNRVHTANTAAADIFVSIHVNQFPDSKYFGAQCFFFPQKEESKILAMLIQDELRLLQPENYRKALAKDLFVLRETSMPAALVELGFISNDSDRQKLMSPEYRNKIANAISKGIERYLNGEKPDL